VGRRAVLTVLAVLVTAIGLLTAIRAATPSGPLRPGPSPSLRPLQSVAPAIVERFARQELGALVGPERLAPVQAVVRRAEGGWLVVFPDVQLACPGDGPFGVDACSAAPVVFRDLYTCVEWDGTRLRGWGARPEPIGAGDAPCGGMPAC